MRGLKLTTIEDEQYFFELDGNSIRDTMFRKTVNTVQMALSTILKNTNLEQPLGIEKLEDLGQTIIEEIAERKLEHFKVEVGYNDFRGWIRIFNEQREQMKLNLQVREDYNFIKARYGLGRQQGLTQDEIDQNYPINDYSYDVIGKLEKTRYGQPEIHYIEDEMVIAKSFKIVSDVCCFGKKYENEPVLCYLQFLMDGRATGLNNVNSTLVKLFLTQYLKNIEFPATNSFIHWRMGSTVFEELSQITIMQMTVDLKNAGILDSVTSVNNAYFLTPNFVTEAVNNGIVRFEFGLQIHLSTQNDKTFEFFIQN